MTKEEALKLALEALELTWSNLDEKIAKAKAEVAAITVIKEALAQPAQGWKLREVYFDEHGEPTMHKEPAQEPFDCPRCGHVCSQRPWFGLTDDDLVQIGVATGLERAAVEMISNKLKEKNP